MADRTFLGAFLGVVGIIAQRPSAWKLDLGWLDGAVGYNAPGDPMSLISATDLAKSYGAQDVFEAVSVAVPHQARVALVGANGVGKTTLLRLLAGYESPDRGQVQRARGLRIGYLPQETTPLAAADVGPTQTLWQMCLGSFAELRGQEAELARLEEEMAEPGHAEEAMARYGPLQEAFERAGGYAYPARIRQVLSGLGFSRGGLRPAHRASLGRGANARSTWPGCCWKTRMF